MLGTLHHLSTFSSSMANLLHPRQPSWPTRETSLFLALRGLVPSQFNHLFVGDTLGPHFSSYYTFEIELKISRQVALVHEGRCCLISIYFTAPAGETQLAAASSMWKLKGFLRNGDLLWLQSCLVLTLQMRPSALVWSGWLLEFAVAYLRVLDLIQAQGVGRKRSQSLL